MGLEEQKSDNDAENPGSCRPPVRLPPRLSAETPPAAQEAAKCQMKDLQPSVHWLNTGQQLLDTSTCPGTKLRASWSLFL